MVQRYAKICICLSALCFAGLKVATAEPNMLQRAANKSACCTRANKFKQEAHHHAACMLHAFCMLVVRKLKKTTLCNHAYKMHTHHACTVHQMHLSHVMPEPETHTTCTQTRSLRQSQKYKQLAHTHTHKCSMRVVCMPIQNAYNRANIPLPCITRSNPMQFEGSHAKAKHAQSTQATMHT